MSTEKTKQLIGSAPLLLVADVTRAARYYHEKLGFSMPQLWGEPPCFAMPQRDGLIVMLQESADVRPNCALGGDDNWGAYFWVADARSLFAEFQQRGAEIAHEPQKRPYYDMLEFAVRDGDGHVLAFGQHWPCGDGK